jgi:hypothetical protein
VGGSACNSWFLYPSAAAVPNAHVPERLSFVGQQGDMFQQWVSITDEFNCETRNCAPPAQRRPPLAVWEARACARPPRDALQPVLSRRLPLCVCRNGL